MKNLKKNLAPNPTKLALGALALLAVAGGGYAYWSAHQTEHLGAGTPLPAFGNADIHVLKEPTQPQGTLLANGPTAQTGTVSITEVTPPPAPEPANETLPNVEGLKLGTTISLLTQAYANGGTLTRQLANVAVDQVHAANVGGELRGAVQRLRDATPQEGPTTPLMMLAEAIRVEAQKAPADLPQSVTPEQPSGNWFVRQLKKLVIFQTNPNDSVDGWTSQLRLAEIQLSRGNGADALVTLTSTPLKEDPRLNTLRQLTRDYLDQQANLTNLINAYTRTFLLPQK